VSAGATVDTYREVLGILREQVATVGPDDLALPTPCSQWDVAGLAAHSIGAMEYYARLARGDEDVRPVTLVVTAVDEMLALFDAAAADGIAAWSEPGVLDGRVRMVLGSMPGRDALAVHIGDLAIHAWDLATACGSALELPADLATDALATWERVFVRLDRGTAFGAEVAVPDDASPTVRLVAYCGRTP
jgi:uncharacterized protein (TIGR03086 family)